MSKTAFRAKIIFETDTHASYFESETAKPKVPNVITYEHIYTMIKEGIMEIKDIIGDELTHNFEPIIIIGNKEP